jgi:hypothetical protein
MNQATSLKAGRTRLRSRLRGQRTFYCVALFITFLVVVYFVLPPPGAVRASLPIFFQRLVGLANALLAMVAAMFAVREYGGSYNRLRVPSVGRVRTSVIVGGIVFLAVLAWWFSPAAPILPLR